VEKVNEKFWIYICFLIDRFEAKHRINTQIIDGVEKYNLKVAPELYVIRLVSGGRTVSAECLKL
jgi:hypothetical protein